MTEDAFLKKIDIMKEKMYKVAYSYMQSQSAAVDMVDEAVYRGYIKRKQLREDAYFETWMIRILINECNKQLKHNKKYTNLEEVQESQEVISENDISMMPLKIALEKLPEDLRDLVMLKYFGGYKIVEIVQILKLPQGTVATRLRKALSLLRIEMEE